MSHNCKELWYNINVNRLGVAIKKLRKSRGLTQGQLAEYSGISSSYISQIETGQRPNPSGQTLEKLATKLDVTVDHILALAEGRPLAEEDALIMQGTRLMRRLYRISDDRLSEEIERLRTAVRIAEERAPYVVGGEDQEENESEGDR